MRDSNFTTNDEMVRLHPNRGTHRLYILLNTTLILTDVHQQIY